MDALNTAGGAAPFRKIAPAGAIEGRDRGSDFFKERQLAIGSRTAARGLD